MSRCPLRALVAIAVLAAAVAAPASADAGDLEDELRRVSERIRSVASQIDDVTASRSNIAAEIRASNDEMGILLAELSVAEAALHDIQVSAERQAGRLEEVRSDLHDSYVHLSTTRTAIAGQRRAAIDGARAAYINAGREIAVLSIAADRITDISIGIEYLERVSGANAGALAALVVLEEQEKGQQESIFRQEAGLAGDLAALEALQAELELAHADVLGSRAELEAKVALQAHLLETLDEELAQFEAELDGLESGQSRIKKRIASEQAAKAAPVSSAGFVRPVPGAITSGFGPRYHPVLNYSRMHEGVDLAAGYGQQIKAARDGTVILAGTWGGYGKTIVIDHGDGLSTLYAHQSTLTVAYGATVSAGDVIGKVGTSGLSSGAHLHFEVRRDGDPVNPALYLKG